MIHDAIAPEKLQAGIRVRIMTTIVTRFAPSPTGFLHLGHAYSAIIAWETAQKANGRFLLRLEDIDPERCRQDFAAAIEEDLAWLGLVWEKPVRRQSAHMADYRAALRRLDAKGVLYPCFCSRKDIEMAAHAPHDLNEGTPANLYPGTCRSLDRARSQEQIAAGRPYVLRLDTAKAQRLCGPLSFHDAAAGTIAIHPGRLGDVVLARRDIPASYHLCVTLDDHLQGVTLVTRGDDLLPATHIHRLLQALLDLSTPDYRHHPLLKGAEGRRLSKRDGAWSLRALRADGKTPRDIRAMAGLQAE